MAGQKKFTMILLVVGWMISFPSKANSDPTFDKLFNDGKFKEALDYADDKVSISDRDAKTWIKIAQANTALGFNEKALACYLVSWRLNPDDYASLVGAAKAYNNLNQPDNAIGMAKKALDKNFTAEASWEYARACIALNRSSEAKNALEKVIQSDSMNAIANGELGNIYYNDKAFKDAIPLLKKTYLVSKDGTVAYKLGSAYAQIGKNDSAIVYIKNAVSKNAGIECKIDLARIYFNVRNYKECITAYNAISQESLSASDLYRLANAKELTQGISDAIKMYELSVSKFGNDVSIDALKVRDKVARYRLQNKNYDIACRHFQFIVENDPKAVNFPDAYFLLADSYAGMNNVQSAIANLEKAIAINNKNVEAYARLSELYQKNNMHQKAQQTLEQMLSLSPNDPGVYLSLGNYNLKAKKYSEAFTMFEKSNTLKVSADALEGMAIVSFNRNESTQARSYAAKAIALNNNLIESRIILSKIMSSENNFKGAQEYLDFVVQKNPDNIENLKLLAECYVQNGVTDKLPDLDRKIISLSSTDTDSRLRLAKIAEAQKNLQEAVSLYKEVLTLKPNSSDILYKLYELSLAANDSPGAMTYIKKLVTSKPNDAEAHGALGDLYYKDKKLDEALSEYRISLKLNPSGKGFLKRYAELVIAKGLQDEVINALANLVKTKEADASTYNTLGLMYEKKKMYSKAIEMYQSALQLEPSNSDILSAMANCQAVSGDINGAIVTYEQVIMMNNKVVNEYKELGDLYVKSLKHDKALNVYKTFLSRDSNNTEVIRFVGNESYTAKDYDAAVTYLGMLRQQATEEELLKYSDACQLTNKTKEEIKGLVILKSRKLKVTTMLKVMKMLADAYEKDGKESDALKVINEIVVSYGNKDPDIMYRKAFLNEKNNQVAAVKIYEENIKLFPQDYRNFLRLGVILSEKQESLSKAVALLQRVTTLAATVPVVWLELGKAYFKMEKNQDALTALKKYAEVDPQNLEVNKLTGILLLKMDRINEGLVYLEIANTIQPNDPVIMINLAKGYFKNGRNPEALDLLSKISDKDKQNKEVRYELFQLYQKTGQKQNALKEIKVLVDSTNDKNYILQYAKCLLENGNDSEAENEIENILAVDAENVEAMMVKALVLRDQKKYDEAIEIYKEISYSKPDYPDSYYERAETHLLQSKYQWAETFYKRAQQADPKFALSELGLAKISKIRKDMASYKMHLENAQKLDSNNPLITAEVQQMGK